MRKEHKCLGSAYGLLAEYALGPSAEEIDENRREMFRCFAKEAE